jgi:hypothetical protein
MENLGFSYVFRNVYDPESFAISACSGKAKNGPTPAGDVAPLFQTDMKSRRRH